MALAPNGCGGLHSRDDERKIRREKFVFKKIFLDKPLKTCYNIFCSAEDSWLPGSPGVNPAEEERISEQLTMNN